MAEKTGRCRKFNACTDRAVPGLPDRGSRMPQKTAAAYPGRTRIANMDIKIPSDLPTPKPAVAQVDQLLAQLKAAGRIEAEVVKLLHNNQLLLSSRLGDILTSNNLNYRAGDRIYLRLDDSSGQPVLKTSPRAAAATILDSRQNPELARALPPDRPALARVIRIIAQQAEIKLAEHILKLPREVAPVKNQLLSLQRLDRRQSIEITPIDSKAIYKAVLKQLIPRQIENRDSSLVRLLNLVNSDPARSVQSTAQAPTAPLQPSTADARPVTAILKAETLAQAGTSANPPAAKAAGNAVQTPDGNKIPPQGVAIGSSAAQPASPSTKPISLAGAQSPNSGQQPAAMANRSVDPGSAKQAVTTQGSKIAANRADVVSPNPGPKSPHRVTPDPAAGGSATTAGNPPLTQKTGNQAKAAVPTPGNAPAPQPHPPEQAVTIAGAGTARQAGATAMPTPLAGPGVTPALQPLLQLITRFPEIDASALKKWLEFARLVYRPRTDSGPAAAADIFRVLKQFGENEGAGRELSQALKQNLRAAGDGDSPAHRSAAQEALAQQIREGVKLVEQSLSHNLLQRASLGLQQETQQPLSFSLALPFQEEEQAKPLYIDLAQRKRVQQDEDKSWDIRLGFDLAGLGPVSCHLVLEGCSVAASFYSELAQTRERIEMELPQLRQQLTRAGFSPGEFHSFPGAPAPQRKPNAADFAESLIDVEA